MTTEKQLRADILRIVAIAKPGGVRRIDILRLLGHVDKRHFQRVLRNLQQEGLLQRNARGSYEAVRQTMKASAILRLNNRGQAYATLEDQTQGLDRVQVATEYVGGALPGDRVLLKIIPEERAGQVEKILSRAHEQLVGVLAWQPEGGYGVRPLRRDLPAFLTLSADELPELPGNPKLGDWVLANLTDVVDAQGMPGVAIVRRLGRQGRLTSDLKAIVSEYNLPAPYTAAAERRSLEWPLVEVDREDHRDLLVVTIDPPDAKDFDDALSLRAGKSPGLLEVGVHIADVACFVEPGGQLDTAAKARGFTAYLPGLTLPMLPTPLAADRCSLLEGEDRWCHSVFLQIDEATGEVRGRRRAHTLIRNRKRLGFDEVERVLDAEEVIGVKDEVRQMLRQMGKLTELMRQRRARLEEFLPMALPEMQVLCGGKPPKLIGLRKVVASPAHELVEEMMLAANEAVAEEMWKKQLPALYRCHVEPEAENLEMYAGQMETIGKGKKLRFTSRSRLVRFLRGLGTDTGARLANMALLRCLPRAQYQVANLGHYGLGKFWYCHFTSPIRRYPDLLVHQQLLAHDLQQPLQSAAQLEDAAARCNDQEQNIDQAGYAAADRFKLRYLMEQTSNQQALCLEGVVWRVTPAGLQVYLEDYGLMGFLASEYLGAGQWRYDPVRQTLSSGHADSRWRFGNVVYVTLLSADTVKGTLLLAPAGEIVDG